MLIVVALDDIRLLAHPGVWKNRIRGRQSPEVGFERADVNRGAVRNIFAEIECGSDFLDGIEAGELTDPHAHGVAGMNQSVRTRLNPTIRAIRISRRPIARALNFSRLNRAVTNSGAGQESLGKSKRINKRFEGRAHLPIGRRQRAVELALRVVAPADTSSDAATHVT